MESRRRNAYQLSFSSKFLVLFSCKYLSCVVTGRKSSGPDFEERYSASQLFKCSLVVFLYGLNKKKTSLFLTESKE